MTAVVTINTLWCNTSANGAYILKLWQPVFNHVRKIALSY